MAMSNRELQEAALEEAKKLNKSISDLSKDTKELSTYGHRNRFLIRFLIYSVVFELIIGVIFGFAMVKANKTTSKANNTAEKVQDTRVTQYDNCLSSNRTRLTQIALWNNIFDTIGENRLPEIPELRHQVEVAFAQRECVIP